MNPLPNTFSHSYHNMMDRFSFWLLAKISGTIHSFLIIAAPFLIAVDSDKVQASVLFDVNVQMGSEPLQTQVKVEQVGGDLKFTLTVDDSKTGNIGDLRAIYFDVAEESLLGGLSAAGALVTSQVFDANNVNNLGGGTSINPLGPFDAGVEIGTPGMSGDDVQTTMFTLSHGLLDLDVSNFFRTSTGPTDHVMAVRGTSVGLSGSRRSGSSKDAVTDPAPSNSAAPEPATIAIWSAFTVGLFGYALRRRRQSPA